jgi:hypothetical protein
LVVITVAQARGQIFENFVGEVLQAFSRRNGLRFDRFGPAFQPDGGKDFAITTPAELDGSLRLFGLRLQAGVRYLVEAKYVESKDGVSQKLGFNRFISNLSQAKLEKTAGVFLVTSTQVNPQALYTASAVAGARDFLIPVPGQWVDRLAQNLGVPRRSDIDVAPIRGLKVGNNITADIRHATRRAAAGELKYYYIALYNDGDTPKSVDIVSQSADDWAFVEASLTGSHPDPNMAAFGGSKSIYERTETIDPGRVVSLGLAGRMTRSLLSATDAIAQADVRIIARCEDAVTELARQSAAFEPVYLPQFMGTGHKKVAAAVAAAIINDRTGVHITLVTGEAGVGKSRTIDEAIHLAGDAELDAYSFTLEGAASSRRKDRHTSNQQAFQDFVKTVAQSAFGQEASEIPLSGCSNIIDVITRVREFRRGRQAENLRIPVFIVEDVHHVDPEIARGLATLAGEERRDEPSCIVILTGRDDSTFDNRHFWSLYSDLKLQSVTLGGPHLTRVEPLTPRSARALIGAIVDEIQESAIDRILRLSGTIPNNIVQCIEFLLDQSLIEVAANAMLSIVDQLTFERRSQTLPSSMARLLAARFELLGDDLVGKRAKHAIIAATLFGTYIPKAALELDFDRSGDHSNEVVDLLVGRRFIHRSHGDYFEWSHESILLHFDAAVRALHFEPAPSIEQYVGPAAASVLAVKDVFQGLSYLERGRAAALAGQAEIAIDCWAPMFTALREASSFASADVHADYYDQADTAIALLAGRSPIEEEMLVALILMKAYVGGVFRSLVFCENAYRTGREWLRRIPFSESVKLHTRQKLELILTHSLMDSGFPGIALRGALELEAQLPFVPELKDDMPFVFDVHNTLRLIYTYSNFYTLAEAHGRRAAEAARRSHDPELKAMDLGDRALMYFYSDWELCRELNRESLEVRRTLPALRGEWHSLVSTMAIDLSARQTDIGWLIESADAVQGIIAECRYGRYHPVLPRIYLLQATITHLLQQMVPHDRSWNNTDTIINLGLDSCERFSIGYVSWQLHNLRAVRAARNGEWRLATRTIRTAAAMIHKEGLTFLGDGHLVSAVPIVLGNFIKIIKKVSTDREIAGMLSQIRGFARYDLANRQARVRCEEQARQTAAILCEGLDEPPFSLLMDTQTNLAITVWF